MRTVLDQNSDIQKAYKIEIMNIPNLTNSFGEQRLNH